MRSISENERKFMITIGSAVIIIGLIMLVLALIIYEYEGEPGNQADYFRNWSCALCRSHLNRAEIFPQIEEK